MKKVYIETFGCQMNVSDSERVATRLISDDFEITANEAAADVVLINTCSVREKAEHKLYTRVGQIRKSARENKENKLKKKQIVGVLGCVAQLEGETLFAGRNEIDFVLGTKAVGRVSQAIEKVLAGQKNYFDLGEREASYDWSVAERQRHSSFVAFVPIIEGCNKFCTYCIVPFSRGREKSLSASEIIRQVLNLRQQGVREVHLIGQNVNSYRPPTDSGLKNFRGATPFSKLLRAVAATGIERIKFNTSFPRDFHPDIVDAICENENLCNWVHLPVQSGSNNVLREMRRGHTIESYLEKIDKIKSSPRKLSLTTDVIIGFPNETDRDFQDTLKMAHYCKFDSAYIFKYSPRPGTPAFAMTDTVSEQVKTARFLELEELIRHDQRRIFKTYLNNTIEVLAEKISNKNDSELSGHTTCQKVVNFKGSTELLGNIVKVKITGTKTNTLYGEICV
ncbi:MAG: tRNA (N6-isopentenyl adenosine(37)-C2)-methylthiotransferase MiaB [Acidobacteriota bacterium]|nr:tRNA (N6-isopentenyl adenosine(37)-C2)-methylthiotransferase MiaB [Acidobacteriota bacterium]